MTDNPSERIQLKHLALDNIDFQQAVDRIKRLAKADQFSYVVTPNIDHLARITTSTEESFQLREVYKDSALTLCDSRIVDKLLRCKGHEVKTVIPGSSLTEYLFEKVLSPDDRILIVGVEPQFVEHLREKYSILTINHINPSMGFINKEDEICLLLKKINEHQPNYTFLSVGSPRQEILAHKISATNNATGVALCVGASVLFLVDAEKRAPLWLQKLHLEWFYRMMQSPKRLVGRYFKNFLQLPAIYRSL